MTETSKHTMPPRSESHRYTAWRWLHEEVRLPGWRRADISDWIAEEIPATITFRDAVRHLTISITWGVPGMMLSWGLERGPTQQLAQTLPWIYEQPLILATVGHVAYLFVVNTLGGAFLHLGLRIFKGQGTLRQTLATMWRIGRKFAPWFGAWSIIATLTLGANVSGISIIVTVVTIGATLIFGWFWLNGLRQIHGFQTPWRVLGVMVVLFLFTSLVLGGLTAGVLVVLS